MKIFIYFKQTAFDSKISEIDCRAPEARFNSLFDKTALVMQGKRRRFCLLMYPAPKVGIGRMEESWEI